MFLGYHVIVIVSDTAYRKWRWFLWKSRVAQKRAGYKLPGVVIFTRIQTFEQNLPFLANCAVLTGSVARNFHFQ